MAAIAGIIALACTDGSKGVLDGPTSGRFGVALKPNYHLLAGDPTEALPINFVRMIARDSITGQELGRYEGPLTSTDPSWRLSIDVAIPENTSPVVVISMELINTSNGVEAVQWSGQTEPITVQAGTTTQPTENIEVYRGPPENLAVTAIDVAAPASHLIEGDSVRLHAQITTRATLQPHIFWAPLDPLVGSVSDSGVVHTLRDGTLRIVAQAGAREDTVTIVVDQKATRVVLSQDTVRSSSIGE